MYCMRFSTCILHFFVFAKNVARTYMEFLIKILCKHICLCVYLFDIHRFILETLVKYFSFGSCVDILLGSWIPSELFC